MIISILTLFPEMFIGSFNQSIIKRAQEKNIVSLQLINIRDFAKDNYKTVDDKPYGGGVGMILKVDVIDRALEQIKKTLPATNSRRIILLDPKGRKYQQQTAFQLAKFDQIILICGHYEGVDARVNYLVDEIISIGDYVLSGGEIPSMAIVDSIVRLLPHALNKPSSPLDESFSDNCLEYPQYTRPEIYKNYSVPEILLSGNHEKILKWKKSHKKIIR